MRHDRLIENIKDQIKEAQMKLGYTKESLRFYYPVDTLKSMLRVDASNADEMLEILGSEMFQNTELGKLSFASHKHRIEVSVSPEGAEYVHKNMEEPKFLKALIALFGTNHHCKIEDVDALFKSFSPNYICKKMPESCDFDVVFYFADWKIDAYYYCVKEEMGHTIYHRFTREDMVELLKDE